jgi:hypothetical protein
MNKSKFITFEYLVKWTQIDENVDPNIVEPSILQAQDINIQTVIGNTLYVRLMNDIITTGTTTGYYLTLLVDYIQPAQAQWTIYHALPYLNYRFTNKSVAEKNSDNSTVAPLETVQYLRNTVRDNAEFLSTRIREYIINNQTQFPEYFSPNNQNLLSIKPSINQYFGGVYLGGRGSGSWSDDAVFGGGPCCP